MDEVNAGDGVLISTQGLLMYLQPPEVESLIRKLRMPIVEVPFAG